MAVPPNSRSSSRPACVGGAPAGRPVRPRVLIIEDSDLNRDLLEQLLEERYDTRSCADGEAGVAAARQERPDVILLDLSLPGIDGWEVARRLRAVQAFDEVAIIAVTAHAMCGDAERAFAAGCDAYLTKPIDEAELLGSVERFVTGRSARAT
jgi:two-component system cell cycle response regulator DivK